MQKERKNKKQEREERKDYIVEIDTLWFAITVDELALTLSAGQHQLILSSEHGVFHKYL